MKKFIYALNILSALPGVILIPLAPFAFLLIDGEGKVPGLAHERACIALLLAYPPLLLACIALSVHALRRLRMRRAVLFALLPLLCALLLAWVFTAGGVRLR